MIRSTSLLLALLPLWCEALSSTVSSHDFATVHLESVGTVRNSVLDGGEWASIQAILKKQKALKKSTKNGFMRIVSGRNEYNERVVAMQCPDDSNSVFEDSVALIPNNVSEQDAISTYIISLSAVHSVLPKAEQVGGSEDTVIAGKVVILGSNDIACFAAEGLVSMGVEVSIVSPGSPKVNKNMENLDVLKPAVGSEEIGFAAHVGEFDSLLDTLHNERPADFYLDLKDDDDESVLSFGVGGTLGLLKSRHNCETYVSMLSHSQTIIAKEGIFGGPGHCDKYLQNVSRQSFLNSPDCQPVFPPGKVGYTVESMLKNGVIFSEAQRKKMLKKTDCVRGWTLNDFWEQTRWPRDSSGSGVRYGLPVVEEPDPDLEPMISEPPSRMLNYQYVESVSAQESEPQPPTPVQDNPYVVPIVSVSGMKSEIEDTGIHCIMFLSAKFCKTCKEINPKYTRMARQAEDTSAIVFAKAEVSGKWGKELGRHLEIDAVPAFILFRNGRLFGTPLSTSKLPSKKINRALDLLESGADWDPNILREKS